MSAHANDAPPASLLSATMLFPFWDVTFAAFKYLGTIVEHPSYRNNLVSVTKD